jgi:hypothetical protein
MPDSAVPARWPAYARVPPFLPVPVRARGDGWTVERQGRFIGLLAETGCVAEAARGVGMSRVAAYQLRARAGAESFVRAWDWVLAIRAASHDGGPRPRKRNFTPSELPEAAIEGPVRVLMRRGRFVRAHRGHCTISLIRHLKRLDALAARRGLTGYEVWEGENLW